MLRRAPSIAAAKSSRRLRMSCSFSSRSRFAKLTSPRTSAVFSSARFAKISDAETCDFEAITSSSRARAADCAR
jgi:hypothetical protein